MAPLTLYLSPISPPCRSVLATAQYLGVEVNQKKVDVRAGETKTPEFLKLNPSHTIPTIEDNGFALFESRAILTYLAGTYGAGTTLYPSDVKGRANVDKLLYYEATAVVPALMDIFHAKFQKKEVTQEALDKLKDKYSILVYLLGNQKFFTGDNVTVADISLGTILFPLTDEKPVPIPAQLTAWYERVAKAVPQLDKLNKEAKEALAKFLASK